MYVKREALSEFMGLWQFVTQRKQKVELNNLGGRTVLDLCGSFKPDLSFTNGGKIAKLYDCFTTGLLLLV